LTPIDFSARVTALTLTLSLPLPYARCSPQGRGFDQDGLSKPLASLATPALTTMRVPRYDLGEMALGLPLRVIEADGDHEELLEVSPGLVVRDSWCVTRNTQHALRITQHALRITYHASRITHYVSHLTSLTSTAGS
jgi:hypothetical protein